MDLDIGGVEYYCLHGLGLDRASWLIAGSRRTFESRTTTTSRRDCGGSLGLRYKLNGSLAGEDCIQDDGCGEVIRNGMVRDGYFDVVSLMSLKFGVVTNERRVAK